MKKIIAFDVDGTLAPSKETIEPAMTRLVLSLLMEEKVAVISGGSKERLDKQLQPLITQAMQDDSVSSNLFILPTSGSEIWIYDLGQWSWKLKSAIDFPPELKSKAVDALNKVIERALDFEIPKDHKGPYIEDRGTQITLSALGQEAPLEEKKKWDPGQSKRKKIREELLKMIGDDVEIGIAGTTSIDILPIGTSKATGLTHLLKYLGLNKEDMLFIGDAVFPGGNDYSPLQIGIETIKVDGPEETANVIQDIMLQLKDGA